MGKKLHLEIVTPDTLMYNGDADRVILRTTEGDIAFLANHEPMVAPLSVGALRVMIDNVERIASSSGGFVKVTKESVTVITDAAEWVESIDKTRAEAARDRAKKRIEHPEGSTDVLRAKIALARALNRIHIVDKYL